MDIQALFGLSILLSFVASGLVAGLYVWPRLRVLAREEAILPLVVPHTFRFIGLSFLIPGVVSPSLPRAFAAPAAYGDLVALLLAVAAPPISYSPTTRVCSRCASTPGCLARPSSFRRWWYRPR